MTRNDVIASAPKIGDILRLRPFTGIEKEKCRVIFVHPENLWYAVEFGIDTGNKFVECFKLPEWNYRPKQHHTPVVRTLKRQVVTGEPIDPVRSARKPIRCKVVETGAIFKSVNACAAALDVLPGQASYALKHGTPISYRDYHIVKV